MVEYGLPLAWAVVLIVTGLIWSAEPWGLVGAAAGGAVAAIVAIGAALRSWPTAVYGALAVTAGGLIAAGGVLGDSMLIAFGVLALVVVGAAVPILAAVRSPVRATGVSDEVLEILRDLHENTMLSENAKRVLFREREVGLLRHAIEADIAEGKYDVALALCDEMADVFGFVEEAEVFRGRILRAREERYETEVRTALDAFDAVLARRDWAAVHQEAARIRRLYGDSHLAQDLPQRILMAREAHKSELEGHFLEAARRDDVETAMTFLKELDRYLAPHEADRLTEVAQGVVTRHRENLGVQFKLAVNDRRWGEAARIGEVIIDEFPNTKMADEVRSLIDVLRMRAEQTTLAAPETS